jgi:hypothetical protein
MEYNQLPVQGYRGFTVGLKQTGRVAHHPPPPNAAFKSVCEAVRASSPSDAFTACDATPLTFTV